MSSIGKHIFDLSPLAKRALLTQLLRKKAGALKWSLDQLATNVTELTAEARLDPSISPDAASGEAASEPGHVFLTGGTGFLGAFLLHEILQRTRAHVYCLVRAANQEDGHQKLRQTLQSYSLWRDELRARITPVEGDLAEPRLGIPAEMSRVLAARVDAIYHSGAMVNWIYPYARLKAANVLGTQEVLRLSCQGKLKPVHYISSLGVFPLIGGSNGDVLREEDSLDHNGPLYGGYLQSKWVADKLVLIARARGLPVSVYRPGLITGDSETGAWNTKDVTSRMLKSWIDLEGAPDVELDQTDMTPVNYISAAIVHLSRQKASIGMIFHLANPRRVELRHIADWIRSYGYPLRRVSYDSWVAELISRAGASREDILSSLVPLVSLSITKDAPELMRRLPQFDCQNTRAGLAGSSIGCSPIDDRVLQNYFSHFIRSGFLNPPPSGGKPADHRN